MSRGRPVDILGNVPLVTLGVFVEAAHVGRPHRVVALEESFEFALDPMLCFHGSWNLRGIWHCGSLGERLKQTLACFYPARPKLSMVSPQGLLRYCIVIPGVTGVWMAASNSDYTSRLDAFEQEIVSYLRTFESIHENLLLGQVRESQAQLVQAAGDMFRRFERDFAPLEPPDAIEDFHAKFVEAMAEISKSYGLFLSAPHSQWTLTFLSTPPAPCRGPYVLS